MKQKKFRIPSKISVAGITYKIIPTIPNLNKEYTIMGRCDIRNRKIYIDKKHLNQEEKEFTFFHELIHASLDAATADPKWNDDVLIHAFSRILWAAVQDSKLIGNSINKTKRNTRH